MSVEFFGYGIIGVSKEEEVYEGRQLCSVPLLVSATHFDEILSPSSRCIDLIACFLVDPN